MKVNGNVALLSNSKMAKITIILVHMTYLPSNLKSNDGAVWQKITKLSLFVLKISPSTWAMIRSNSYFKICLILFHN